jgi:hypothetical protein
MVADIGGEAVDHDAELETDDAVSGADDGGDEVIEDALDTDDDFAPFDEVEASEDDPELEISDDLDDLSRAAGVALAGPAEPSDGSSTAD